MAWTRQGRLKNILSIEVVGAEGWHGRWHLRQGRLECWHGGLDQQRATDKSMAPIRRACKRWDDSARRWHEQELDGCKVNLWALSWRGQGKEG
ncbi:hypothetical protein HAX54_017767 [Datura stramonium]|uniref:Uncharacterized protein n=1 Tax=Datura stramonium TaxID=4076 RepID=A0ABS8ULB4_DATST|nr:hypothetical protein [Datura stramonium]